MFNINTFWFEIAMVSSIFALGNVFFGHFEERTPKLKKVLKFLLFNLITVSISAFFGRTWTVAFYVLMTLGVVYIHGFWLPSKGINGLTGEPKDKYYKLRGWKK
ncbi:MAG TPA: hypothetical protein VD999_02930 [Vitreimonas sp.]|nr:hypothetical protein [Vitreimonas sp.]